jgi:hypothetical protein
VSEDENYTSSGSDGDSDDDADDDAALAAAVDGLPFSGSDADDDGDEYVKAAAAFRDQDDEVCGAVYTETCHLTHLLQLRMTWTSCSA